MSARASEVSTTHPRVCRADTPIRDVAAQMCEGHVGEVLVVADNGSVHGIITDRDIVIRAVAAGHHPDSIPAGEVCSTPVHTTTADAPVSEAADLMRRHDIRRVPVMDGEQATGVLYDHQVADAAP